MPGVLRRIRREGVPVIASAVLVVWPHIGLTVTGTLWIADDDMIFVMADWRDTAYRPGTCGICLLEDSHFHLSPEVWEEVRPGVFAPNVRGVLSSTRSGRGYFDRMTN